MPEDGCPSLSAGAAAREAAGVVLALKLDPDMPGDVVQSFTCVPRGRRDTFKIEGLALSPLNPTPPLREAKLVCDRVLAEHACGSNGDRQDT